MKISTFAAVLAGVVLLPVAGHAEADGSRQQAGGAHMSSYVTDPYHDPRSLHSQRRGSGQILGQPMLSENAGARPLRRSTGSNWASGRSWRNVR